MPLARGCCPSRRTGWASSRCPATRSACWSTGSVGPAGTRSDSPPTCRTTSPAPTTRRPPGRWFRPRPTPPGSCCRPPGWTRPPPRCAPNWPSRSRRTPRSPRSSRRWSSSTTPTPRPPGRVCWPSRRRYRPLTNSGPSSRLSWPTGSRPLPEAGHPPRPGAGRRRRPTAPTTCGFGVLCGLVAHENPTLALPVKEHGPVRAIGLRIFVAVMCVVITTVVVYVERADYRDLEGQIDTWLDALYYATVTLSTTGYGDITPVTEAARLTNIVIITPLRFLFLIVLVGTTIEVLTERSRQQFRTSRWRKRVKKQ